MSKYNKYMPKLSPKKAEEISRQIDMRANAITIARGGAAGYKSSDSPYNYTALRDKWEAKNVNILDVVQFGPFSAREMLVNLGFSPEDYQREYNLHLVEALNEFFEGAVVMNYDENDKIYIDVSEKGNSSAADLTDDFAHQQLTKWDKFWGFFGIKTDHAKDVMAHNAMIDSTKLNMKKLDGKVYAHNNKPVVKEYLNDKNYNTQKSICDKANAEYAKWEKAFFGDKKPKDYPLTENHPLPALTVCLVIYNKNTNGGAGKLDIDNLTEKDKTNIQNAVAEYNNFLKKRDLRKKYDYVDEGLHKFENEEFSNLFDTTFDISVKGEKVTANDAVKAYPILRAKDDLHKFFQGDFETLKESENSKEAAGIIKKSILSLKLHENIEKGNLKEAMDIYNKASFNKENPVKDYKDLIDGAKNLLENGTEIVNEEAEIEKEMV